MIESDIQKEEYPELSPYERQKMLMGDWTKPRCDEGSGEDRTVKALCKNGRIYPLPES